ncbi:MAG: hypothetical protein HYY16_16890 [Planctomycetes bacterium]|nr:hypothetical protein [Planctomycetota bacterium]
MWLVVALLLQDTPVDAVRQSVEETAAASYSFTVTGRFRRRGEWIPDDILVSRIDVFQSVRHGATILVKGPEGLWKTPDERVGEATENERPDVADMMRTLEEARPPHLMTSDLVAAAKAVSRSDDTTVDGAPCRTYYLTFPEKRLRDELQEEIELAVRHGTLEKPDKILWSSLRGHARVTVRVSDGRIARITEQSSVNFSQGDREKKFELRLTLTLGDFGKATLDLPDVVKKRLGIQ